MAWTTYKSTDGSAPVIDGQVGSLITVLDAVLVNGYGAQPAAGWTKDYSGTNKAAYRNAAGSISRTFLQVLDDGPGSHGGREARLRLYSTMSDVDTGTLPTPTVAQSTPGIVARKSNTANSTARSWVILADEKTAIILITPGDTAAALTDLTCPIYAGDLYSYLTADAQGAVLGGRQTEAVTNMAPTNSLNQATAYGATSYISCFIVGSHTGVAGSLPCYLHLHNIAAGIQSTGSAPLYPNPTDGAVYIMGPALITSSSGIIRGHLRGVNYFCHTRTSVSAGDTVSGTGDLTGKAFILAPCETVNASSASLQPVIAYETSTPAASS